MKAAITIAVLAGTIASACGTAKEQAAAKPLEATAGTRVSGEGQVIADFESRVDAYVKLRDTLANQTARLKKTDDPAAITSAEQQLAEKIRAARPNAARGDFFTPEVAALFKRLLRPSISGAEGLENKNAIKDDNPQSVPFTVGGDYPKVQTVSTVPPDVLLSLPALPDNLQYRFVGRHMILYDARSNTIVDYLLNVLP